MAWCNFCKDGSTFFSTRYYCTISGKEVEIPTSYYEFCKHDYMASKCPFYKQYGPSSGCFITTVACDILGEKDNSEVLNNLRNFRDNYLQKNEDYSEILKMYDTIGPMLASRLMMDDNKEELAKELYDNTLKPISDLVTEGKNARAVKHYMYMTLYLVSMYGYKDEYNELNSNNYGYTNDFDITNAGHGKHSLDLKKVLKNA